MRSPLHKQFDQGNESLIAWNGSEMEATLALSVGELFETQVRRTPDAIALVQGNASLSYRELNRRANQLCWRLRRLGVRSGDIVGVSIERSIELVVALLGILKAGAAYLPLGTENPDSRLRFMIEDTGASLVLASDEMASRLTMLKVLAMPFDRASSGTPRVMSFGSFWRDIKWESDGDRVEQSGGENAAYVMYTSGTTGEPKGIEVKHRAIVRLVKGVDYVTLTGEEVFLQYAPISFDASTFEIWGCLLNGGRLVLAPASQMTLEQLGEIIARYQITTLWLTAGLFHAMVDERLEDLLKVRQLLAGGDVLSVEHARKVLESENGPVLINGYGPTEGTTFTCCNPMTSPRELDGSVLIGPPIANTQVYVLDRELNRVSPGTSGHLFISGDGLANGYVRRPGLTAAKFLPNPHNGKPGSRMYQTGDRVRSKPDGSIEFLGRVDNQVKVRGFRVELGEIESVLSSHPKVRQSVVVPREDKTRQKQLIAFALPLNGAAPTTAELKDFMRERLPDYMVPVAILIIERLPLTANGKVDRKALLETTRIPVEKQGDEPRTATEGVLAAIWCDILEQDQVGVNDDFFDLGGDSLTATRLISRVQKTLGVELSVRSVFECPTIAGLTSIIGGGKAQELDPVPLRSAPVSEQMPLSFAQERMWFLDRIEPGNITYNVPLAILIEGDLNDLVLEKSFYQIVLRHEVLRTVFAERDGEPKQQVQSIDGPVLTRIDLRGLRTADREDLARELMREEARRPFDLANGPLFRVTLLQLNEKKRLLLMTMHHIVTDGWSISVLFSELKTLYAAIVSGQPGGLRELTIQYRDFAYLQREWLREDLLRTQLDYWREQLKGARDEIRLPRDRERPPIQTFRGGTEEIRISPELGRALREISQRERVSLFMTLLAGFNVLLSRYSGETDITVGTPIANRNREELEGLIGFFVNTLAIRSDLSRRPSFKELLQRTSKVALAAYAHQDLPFERLVEEMHPKRSLNVTPIFQIMFVLQNTPACELELGTAKLTTVPVATGTTQFDLILSIEETGHDLLGTLQYNLDLFEPDTVRRMRGHLVELLSSAISHPEHRISDLSILTQQEYRQIVFEWNQTDQFFAGPHLIHALFECQADMTPHATALVCRGAHLTYGELNASANTLARRLRELGAAPEVCVAICAERGIDLVVGLLAILKCGAAYVPLDPEYPKQRLAYMLEDSRAEIVVVTEATEALLRGLGARTIRLDIRAGESMAERRNLPCRVIAANLAYLIYTSGSSGQPKGVMVSHGSACNHLLYRQTRYPLYPEDRFLHKASFAFDISVWEIFGTLIQGAQLIVASNDEYRDPIELVSLIKRESITVMHSSPLLLDALLQEGLGGAETLREVFCGGEPLSIELLRRFFADSKANLHHQYGPTETTIDVTLFDCEPANELTEVPIGKPIANTKTYVLTDHFQPAPVGVSGELFVGGEALARGYLGRPDSTARAFLPDPFSEKPGARLYQTGDQVLYRTAGYIRFIGRKDNQVKVRGFRVELGEIEAILNSHPAVREAVVAAREDSDEKRLIGYAVAKQGAQPTAAELKEFMSKRLPDHMLPAAVVFLESLPLTANGKVDRKALPEIELGTAQREWIEPRTPIEELLTLIWVDLLKVKRVSVNDRFFDLGGHSLLASRMVSRIRSTFAVDLRLRAIFEEPTIELLARRVEQETRRGRPSTPPITPAQRNVSLPLSFAQQRLWFLEELDPTSTAYSIPLLFELDGPVDEHALEFAFGEIIRRHEILRTVLQSVDGCPEQLIRPSAPVAMLTIDLSALPAPIKEEELTRVVTCECRSRFVLSEGPLIRVRLMRIAALRSYLLINMHHTVSDGWSLEVLWKELEELYSAYIDHREPQLPQLPIQYADYAVWQRNQMQGEVLAEQIAYWRNQLSGLAPIDLPADKPREGVAATNGEAEEFTISPELTAAIKTIAGRHGATTFMILLSAFKVLLYRWTGQHDVAVGSPIAGRSQAETENLIGFFVNTIVLRTDLSGNPGFSELIRRVRAVALDAYSHQDIPFEKLVEELQPERDVNRSPFFQVFFNMLGADRPGLELPGVIARSKPLPTHESKFDLSLYAVEDAGEIKLTLVYNADLFRKERIADLARQLELLLLQVTENPELPIKELTLVTPAAREVLPDPRKRLERIWVGAVHDRIKEHAQYRPEAVAVADATVRMNYKDLDLASNRVANLLISKGVVRGDVVAVIGWRGAALVTALVGVMKAGAAFAVLDAAFPDDRLIAQLEIVKPSAWLATGSDISTTLEKSLKRLSRGFVIDSTGAIVSGKSVLADCVEAPAVHVEGYSPAYIAFTSGSTGAPKAILGTHAPLSHFLDWHSRTFKFTEQDRFCMLSGLSHDPLLRDIFAPLWVGATLYIPNQDDIGTSKLTCWMRREAITVAHVTPALAATLTEGEQEQLPELRQVFFGGDVLTSRTLNLFKRLAPEARFVNFYGTTETPQAMGYFVIDEPVAERVPLGRGIEDAQLLLLNESGGLAGIGELGGIAVRTPYLTVGYVNDSELTETKYVANPVTGCDADRIYKTGDLGRYSPDGNVEFVGRSDSQVKVRGYRIELAEVQAALRAHTGVRDCAVLPREYGADDCRLVAYVVPAKEPPSARDLRNHLSGRLPAYMLPSSFVNLDRLPLTPNGKLDSQALPLPMQSEDDQSHHGPRTVTEELIFAIWQQVLRLERIGINDNFFEIGGHSLLAMQVNSRIRETFHQDLPLRELFTHPTIEQLARRVDELRSGSIEEETPITRIRRTGPLPFSFNEGAHLFADWYVTNIRHEKKLPFHLNVGLRIHGSVNLPALEDALNEIIRRHEVLRTAFSITADGSARTVSKVMSMDPREIGLTLFKRTIRPRAAVNIVLVNIENLAATEKEGFVEKEFGRPFDYQDPPMLRALLFKMASQEYHLTLLLHHIAFDGWSVHILRQELIALYDVFSRGEPSSMDELPFQYVDFAEWQNRKLKGEFLEKTIAYWERSLADFTALDARELGFPAPAAATRGNAYENLVIEDELLQEIRSFARRKKVTLSMLLLSVLDSLLYLYTGKEKIGIWTYFANRTRGGTEAMIGWFAHRHFIAMEIFASQRAEAILEKARDLVIDGTANSELPYILVQMHMNQQASRGAFSQGSKNAARASGPVSAVTARDDTKDNSEATEPSGNFTEASEAHIEFDLMTGTVGGYSSGGLVIDPVHLPTEKYQPNLRLYGADQGSRLVLTARYPTDLFYDATIREMLADFRRVLEGFIVSPDATISSFAEFIRATQIDPNDIDSV